MQRVVQQASEYIYSEYITKAILYERIYSIISL